MFRTLKDTKRGFTLIELLVVIAIIGILSSVVLASLSTAREKARDSKRISDVEQLKLGLELYFDSFSSYPISDADYSGTYAVTDAGNRMVSLGYLPRLPVDPNSANYVYRGIQAPSNSTECTATSAAVPACLSYVVGINLERTDNPVLRNDTDATVGAVFYGLLPDCTVNTAGTEKCYDSRP